MSRKCQLLVICVFKVIRRLSRSVPVSIMLHEGCCKRINMAILFIILSQKPSAAVSKKASTEEVISTAAAPSVQSSAPLAASPVSKLFKN